MPAPRLLRVRGGSTEHVTASAGSPQTADPPTRRSALPGRAIFGNDVLYRNSTSPTVPDICQQLPPLFLNSLEPNAEVDRDPIIGRQIDGGCMGQLVMA